jgi:hypothetical protein
MLSFKTIGKKKRFVERKLTDLFPWRVKAEWGAGGQQNPEKRR